MLVIACVTFYLYIYAYSCFCISNFCGLYMKSLLYAMATFDFYLKAVDF